MCNGLTIKATKFQQSSTNRFLAVAKKLHWGGGGKFDPPYKLGLTIKDLFIWDWPAHYAGLAHLRWVNFHLGLHRQDSISDTCVSHIFAL